MRDILAILLRKKAIELPQTSPEPQRHSGATLNLPRGPVLAQKQSALLGKMPTEVRLAIYSAVLTDSQRLLHIVHGIPRKGMLSQMGHWRCDDLQNLQQVWQHRCFGCWYENGIRCWREQRQVNSDLMSLLLTCRYV
jgi:hypothetical protein